MEKMINLVLVGNHILMRAGIRSLLGAFDLIHVSGEAGYEECVVTIQTFQPDIVLLGPSWLSIILLLQIDRRYSPVLPAGLYINHRRHS